MPAIQNMREVYGSGGTAYNSSIPHSYQGSSGNEGNVDSSVGFHIDMNTNMWSGETVKKKRAHTTPAPEPPLQSGAVSPNSVRKRGRPRGSLDKKKRESRKKKSESRGSRSIGVGFIPHIITVNVGENVAAKIVSFSQHSFKAVCILSARGAVSNVTLRQPTVSGGSVTCEGRFEILSLSGSYILTESDGQPMRSGGLSVSLSGPDGRVMGGEVAGLLIAASPVQVIIGMFDAEGGEKLKTPHQKKPSSALPNESLVIGSTGPNSSPSAGSLSESSSDGGSGSPLNYQNAPNNIQQGMTWN